MGEGGPRLSAQGRLALRGPARSQGELRLEWLGSRGVAGSCASEIEAVGVPLSLRIFEETVGPTFKSRRSSGRHRSNTGGLPPPPRAGRNGRPAAARAGNGGDLLALRRYAPAIRIASSMMESQRAQPTVARAAVLRENIERYSLWLRTDASVWTRPSNSNCSSVLPRPRGRFVPRRAPD